MKKNISSTLNKDVITLVCSGKEYFEELERIINLANIEIHLQTYILEEDATGIRIANALKRAALRKVNVYLLLDGLGSRLLSEVFVNDLKSYGIQFRFFSPLFSLSSFYFGRRLHHKIVVVDTKITLIGGINIAEKYEGTPLIKPWLDYAVLIDDTSIAKQAQWICDYYFFKKKSHFLKKKESDNLKNHTSISLLQNDWLLQKDEIQKAYLKSIQTAQSKIIIVSGYFLPGRKLTQALKKAAQRNVRIQLLLSGASDVPLVKSAIDYYYAFLLRNNIELYEWNQSILHGKTAVVDQKWTTIGSFNLNHLSSKASIEMNAVITSEAFAKKYQKHLNEIISECRQITPEGFRNQNNPLTRFKKWISYIIVRFFETLLTYQSQTSFFKGITK